MFQRVILRFSLLGLCMSAFLYGSAQEKPLPDELKPFLLQGYEVLDFITGDLNGDKKPDAILIQRIIGEDTLLEEDYIRPLMILVRQSNNKLKKVVRNDSAILCRRCGGVFGDPYESASIEHNGFSLYFYGGSAERWAYEYRFAWKSARQDWMLVFESQNTFNSLDPEMKITEVTIKEAELGPVSIKKFNSTPVYEDSRWKVIAAKTFFYTSPDLASKPRKGYLLKGNVVTGIRQLKNYIEVSFENDKSEFTYGYILRKDLHQIK